MWTELQKERKEHSLKKGCEKEIEIVPTEKLDSYCNDMTPLMHIFASRWAFRGHLQELWCPLGLFSLPLLFLLILIGDGLAGLDSLAVVAADTIDLSRFLQVLVFFKKKWAESFLCTEKGRKL